MAQVTVSVNNQTYTLACDDGEEGHLTVLAKLIDTRIADIRKDVKSAGEPLLLLMAGLLLADELELANERIQELEESLAGVKGEFLEPDAELPPRPRNGVDADKLTGLLEKAARRMEDIAARLR
ncbi:MAG: cell division protein ZapA [Micropepsaceae bacterium]